MNAFLYRGRLISLFGLVAIVVGFTASAQSPSILLEPAHTSVLAGRQTFYYEDKTNTVTISHILEQPYQSSFVRSDKDILAFGLSRSTYWLKIPVRYLRGAEKMNWLLELTLASYTELSFFHEVNGQWKEQKTGAALAFSERPINYRFFVFPLPIEPGEEKVFYLRIKTLRAYTIPLVVYRQDFFISKVIREEWLYGAFIGILVFIGFYNLLLFFSLQQRSYIYCGIYVLLSALLLGVYNGYVLQFLGPSLAINPVMPLFYITLLQRAFIVIFALSFLQLKKEGGIIYRLMMGNLLLFALLFILSFVVDTNLLTQLQLLISLFALGLTTFAGFYYLQKGQKQVRFYVAGYFLYSIGILLNNLLFFNLTTPSFISIHGPEIGIFLEAIFLTLALGDKYRIERTARTEELNATVNNLVRQNEDLEQFSYIVSHNLRSPVARIMGLINVYQLSEDREILMHLKKSAHSLEEVIKDLTQIVSIRKSLNATREVIDLSHEINNELAHFEDIISETHTTVQMDLRVETITAIKSYIRSILHNLISNAIKYRDPDRKLTITISTFYQEESVVLTVRDTGLGMNTKDSYKIFGLYQRMHDHVEGKGLGLYLAKTQADAMKGKIEVTSVLRQGSSFRVILPK
jgi:signal transduction histidine kinase